MALRDLALRQLDATLQPAAALRALTRPKPGWAAAIRRALGLTTRQMAKRLGLSQSSYADAESNEAREAISLKQLRRIADALDCDLVYALLPRRPLTEMVDGVRTSSPGGACSASRAAWRSRSRRCPTS